MDQFAIAATMRAAGHSWARVSEATGLTVWTLRAKLEEGMLERQRQADRERRALKPKKGSPQDRRGYRPDPVVEIPPVPVDTRSFTARQFGDPLPGRSALDRMSEARP
jgi:hypothetical protein